MLSRLDLFPADTAGKDMVPGLSGTLHGGGPPRYVPLRAWGGCVHGTARGRPKTSKRALNASRRPETSKCTKNAKLHSEIHISYENTS